MAEAMIMIFKVKESVWKTMSDQAKTGFNPGDRIMLIWFETKLVKGFYRNVERHRFIDAPILR